MENDKVFLTKEGLEKLQEELRFLKEVERIQVVQDLKEARAQGDLSENADYDAARNKQAQIESRIIELENMLANAKLIDEKAGGVRVVRLGATVTIKDLSDDSQSDYVIVGAVETDPINGKISNESPLAQAILNKGVGAICTVHVSTPYDVEIVNIKR